jgi:hypothetical protein
MSKGNVPPIVANPIVVGRAQGEANRGWQDKSADGCRAHVVGWANDFSDPRYQHAGAFATKFNPINGAAAITGIRGNGNYL